MIASSGAPPTPRHEWGSAPEFVGPRHDYRESLMRRRLLPMLPGPRVLNAGCGAGSMTLALLDVGLDVTSVDASGAFVAVLGARVASRDDAVGASRGVLVADLGRRLPFDDDAFDAVVCGEVLEHLDDDVFALREFARVLSPGGLLVVSVPANPRRYDWVDAWAGHRRRYTPGALTDAIVSAGFSDIHVEGWGFPFTGLYHRWVYRPLLRRRLARAATPPKLGPGVAARRSARILRAALELDSLAGGRFPGWFGLIATARRPARRET